MAQLVNVRLSRADAAPWGFRLQGGKDFGQPLLIQKVNGGSAAERAGLQVGDALIRVNGVEVQEMRHKDAQDTIVRAGNNIDMSIQRGGISTWKPQVNAVGSLPTPGGQSPVPVTKTSLAAKPSTAPVPTGHNVSPRPFGGASTPQLNGGGDVKALVSKQYNSPIGVYSEETIAETLSAQTEVLATGALGVNFMKNEKTYDSTKSEVLKMVQEVEKEPREHEPETIAPNVPTTAFPSVTGLRHVAPPEAQPASSPNPSNPLPPGQNICADCERLIVDRSQKSAATSRILRVVFTPLSNAKYFSTTSHAVGGRATSPRPLTPIARQMGAPSTPELPQDKPYMPPASPMPGSPVCSECGKHIVGVFVRIKDKNLHVECFKCATCGSSLKNVGYYTINNKLYCDIHAKMVARQNPPAPNLDPITVAPGARIPTGIISSPTPPAPLPSSLPTQPPKVARLPSSAPPQPVSQPVSFPPSLPTAAPQSPQPGTLAPLPFHTPSAPAPKPFGSVTAPAPAPPTTIQFTPSALQSNFGAPPSNFGAPPSNFGAPHSNFSASKPQTDNLNPVIWPPIQNNVFVSKSDTTSSSKTEERFEAMARKKMSICSQEVCKISESCNKEICRLTGETYDNRPGSPLPDRELELIVRQNVVAAAHSQGERKSKRSTSQTVSKMTTAEGVCAQSLATQLMMLAPRGLSPQRGESPEILDISSRPHQIKSLLPPACAVRPMTPTQVVVFPPNLPDVIASRSRSSSPLPPTGRTNLKKKEQKKKDPVKGSPPFFMGLPVVTPKPGPTTTECKVEELESKACPSTQLPIVTVTEDLTGTNEANSGSQDEFQTEQTTETSQQTTEISEQEQMCTRTTVKQEMKALEYQSKTEVTHKTIPEKPLDDKLYTKNEVEKIVKEELKKVFLKEEVPPKKDIEVGPSIDELPLPVYALGGMAMALSTASDRPFTPAPFPRAPEMSLYPNKPKETPKRRKAPEKYVTIPEPSEPYFPPPPPPPDTENKDERTARALREVGCRSLMTEALTTAPDRSYSPLPTSAQVDLTKLSSLKIESTEKTCITKSSESSCPIKSVKAPITLSGTASAFKRTGNGNGSLIPKSTPLVYIPQSGRDQREPRMGERYGIDRTALAQGGKTKEIIAGFEHSQTIKDTSSEINETEFAAMKLTDVQYGCAVAKNPPPQASSSTTQKPAPSGLRGDHLLPSYQQWLGDIPVRNAQVRAFSPLPHPIKAPSMEPRPMPQTPSFPHHPRTQAYYSAPRSRETQKYSSCASQAISTMSADTNQQTSQTRTLPHALAPNNQQELQTCARSQAAVSPQSQSSSSTKTVNQSATVSSKSTKISSRSVRTVSPLAGKSASVTTSGKQTFKPDIPARALSPSWKADYVRSVQNLSPITVRLPSPVPPPMKPKGEQTQVTSANVTVKNKSKTTTASHSKPPTSTTQSTKTQPTAGHCGTSQGCGTPPGTPKGRRSPTNHCGTSQGCGTPPGTPKGRCSPTNHCGTSQGCGTPPGSPKGRRSPTNHCGTSQGCGTPVECRSQTREFGRGEFSTHQNANVSSKISNKENISTSMMHSSEKKAASLKSLSYTSTFSSNANEKPNSMYDARKAAFTNKLVGILKQSSETDTKSQVLSNSNGQSSRNPLQPSFVPSNTSWQPFPTNLPLPRNCGVNPSSSGPNAGGAGGLGGGKSSIAGSTAPRRGRGVLNAAVPAGGRVPLCGHCNNQIRGPFITALGKIWCPEHFICVNPKCKRPLQDIGFVEEDDGLYCEYCFEQYLAPSCDKCRSKIKGDCLNAIGKHFHPECFKCSYCEKLFGNNPFFLEDGLPYCENDWNELFTTKCFSCGFPIEAGDRWVEALNNNYHSQCFNCTMCKKNLEGQSFFAKGGRPFCKNHAR